MYAHQCLLDIIELYSGHIDVHLNASNERLLEEYQKKYKLKDMPNSCVTRPQAKVTSAAPPPAQSTPSETFGERARRLLNERDDTVASTEDTTMAFVVRPAKRELPPQPYTFIDPALYIKLKTTLKVISVLGWE